MRLFIALDFNKLKEYFTDLQKNINPSLAKIKTTDAFHLTLKFLGEVSEDQLNLIIKELNKIKFEHFSLNLDKLGVFPSENYIRIVWVGVSPHDKVIELQKRIETSLSEFNKENFHPHITLARVKFVKDKENFIKSLKAIKIEQKTIEVNDFRLIKSTLTPEGPIYEDLEIFS
jgi:2'-5' RNA ligase